MTIGIFSEAHDRQALALWQCLEELAPGRARHFLLPGRETQTMSLAEEGVYWDGVDVSRLELAYIHGYQYHSPILPRLPGNTDWSVWQSDYLIDQQQASFLYSAFLEMARRGVRLLNPPPLHIQDFLKADLLERLRDAGLRVPKLLCTNDGAAAADFMAAAAQTAWRPVTGRAAWQLFLERQRQHLFAPQKPPVLLAEAIDGPLIRAYLFDGQPLLCLKRIAASNAWNEEALEKFQVVDCQAVHAALRRASEVLDLRWGMLLFVLKDGEAWFYDVDGDPIYDWLPEVFFQHLTRALAMGMTGHDPATLPALPDTPQPRQTLFLRRMLHLLFEFERQKYQQP